VVEGLSTAQVVVSVVASVAVVVLTRDDRRWLAWAIIVAIGAFAWYVALGAWMSITGIYL
jgi:hypothetical protein